MKISVCIPVYNFDVGELVNSLRKEIENSYLDAEIILIDDASTSFFVEKNKPLVNIVNQFIFLEKNIGRSAIRNRFLQYAKGEYLLFLDCDSKIISESFIGNYLRVLESDSEEINLIFGGFDINDSREITLRKKYSLAREMVPLFKRREHPYDSFRGINFLVKKEILEQFPFDESIKNYGYEDLIFSKNLEFVGLRIHHIENPVLHDDDEDALSFLEKTKIAIDGLVKIYYTNPTYVKNMKILKSYRFLKAIKFLDFGYMIFKKYRKNLQKTLLKNKPPSLVLLDLYKLGLLIESVKNKAT